MDGTHKALLLVLLIVGITTATLAGMCLVHNEAMAKMGYCQSPIMGNSQVYWQKCVEAK